MPSDRWPPPEARAVWVRRGVNRPTGLAGVVSAGKRSGAAERHDAAERSGAAERHDAPRRHQGTGIAPTEAGGISPQASVSIVICAYTERRLESVVAGVRASLVQLRSGDEIVIVIDHNAALVSRVSDALATSIADGTVRVGSNVNARGLSGARNAGVAAARGDIVVFLDDDAVPQAGWLESLREPFDAPDVIGVGGRVEPQWEAAAPTWFPDEFLWVVGCSYRGLPETTTEIRNPIGANMAFRTDVVRQAGGFTDGIGRTETVPLGCEETEFSIRASQLHGGRIVQQPAARVSHLVPRERGQLRYFLRRCWAEGVSKAIVADMVGADRALDSERSYVTHTLPAGIVRAFRTGGPLQGLEHTGAIGAGLVTTALGYGRTRVARALRSSRVGTGRR